METLSFSKEEVEKIERLVVLDPFRLSLSVDEAAEYEKLLADGYLPKAVKFVRRIIECRLYQRVDILFFQDNQNEPGFQGMDVPWVKPWW